MKLYNGQAIPNIGFVCSQMQKVDILLKKKNAVFIYKNIHCRN